LARRRTSSRRYTLRDLLVVGIGDSFASGQGNPDAPAVRAPDEKAICKVTSLALFARRVEDAVTAFVEEALRLIPDGMNRPHLRLRHGRGAMTRSLPLVVHGQHVRDRFPHVLSAGQQHGVQHIPERIEQGRGLLPRVAAVAAWGG
jgi:hypothetical protein